MNLYDSNLDVFFQCIFFNIHTSLKPSKCCISGIYLPYLLSKWHNNLSLAPCCTFSAKAVKAFRTSSRGGCDSCQASDSCRWCCSAMPEKNDDDDDDEEEEEEDGGGLGMVVRGGEFFLVEGKGTANRGPVGELKYINLNHLYICVENLGWWMW